MSIEERIRKLGIQDSFLMTQETLNRYIAFVMMAGAGKIDADTALRIVCYTRWKRSR